MIEIKVKGKGGYSQITISGHANYAANGKDIVCAGISAINHTMILGLKAIAESYPGHVKIEIDDEYGG